MMKHKCFGIRILSMILAVIMASTTMVCTAETEKTGGLAGMGSWFVERGQDIKEGAAEAGAWIGDIAGDAWDSTSDARKAIGDAANDAWNATADAAACAGKWIGDTADVAWHSTVEIAVDVGDWMKTNANDAWDSTEDVRIWIAGKAYEAWDSATEAVAIAGTWVSDNASEAWESITNASDATGKWICDTAGEIQVISADALDSAGQFLDDTGKELVYFATSTGEIVAAYVEGIDKAEVIDYLSRSGEKLILGEYSDLDPTLLSIGGTLAASVVNLDVGMDIRDVVYGIQHFGSENAKVADIALSAVGLIPVIGVIKPAVKFLDAADTVTTIAKAADDAVDVVKATDAVSDIAKAVDAASDAGKAAEIIDDAVNVAKAAEKLDDVADMAKAVDAVDTAGDAIKSLDELKNIDNFRDKKVLEHIFLGNYKNSGKPSGYHHESEDSIFRVIPNTKSETNDYGVYNAWFSIDGENNNKKYSTFFPENMTRQEIVDSINEVYEKIIKRGIAEDAIYSDVTSIGMKIEMYIENGKIITAYPKMK